MNIMPFSKEIPELFVNEASRTATHWSPRHSRDLYSADNYNSYLVDSSGNAYEPYSLAWRYLGLYIDCDISNSTNFYQYYNYDNARRLPEDNNDGECERKLLWAAYHDPKYKGNTIEEYQFYDFVNGTYDDSTCQASGTSHRCVKLDCHERHTHFELVGVFKETEGMYDFTEQLFKHQGYCIWQGDEDGDIYDTMETWMEKWPTTCKQLSMPDYYGNTLYISTHPLPEGNMTLEIYTDNRCTMLSEDMNLEAYILNLYNYYGYNGRGKQVAQEYAEAIDTWNEKMSVFKVCQPCRAYNLYYDQNRNSHDHRRLENDGEGDENERYNCYDDAGYTNVDQCYKFETHTKLEPAYDDDLSLADDQGSILLIHANGRTYGRGEPYSTPFIAGWDWSVTPEQMMYISFGSIAIVWISMLLFFHRRHKKKCKSIPSSFGDSFYDDEGGEYDSDDSDSTKASDYSERSNATYSPPTIELTDTADYSAKAGCCAQDPRINLSQSEMRSIESVDEDSKYKQDCYINYDKHSDANTFEVEHDHGSIIQPEFGQTISEMESVDSEDRSQFKTRSYSTTYIGNVSSCASEDQSSAAENERKSQPDIIGMNQSDMSSFESINDKANRLQQWKSQQQQLAQTTRASEDQSTAESERGSQPDIIGMNQSDMSSFESINDKTNRLQEWKSQQQKLAQSQNPQLAQLLPPAQILDKVEEQVEDQEEGNLGDALLRVRQRILQSKQYGRESPGDVSTAASSMSSIV